MQQNRRLSMLNTCRIELVEQLLMQLEEQFKHNPKQQEK